MGFFDNLQPQDPDTAAALNRGLIAMGLQLMQARGRSLFPALGQGGMAGVQAYDQQRQMQQKMAEQQQMQKMRQLQLGQAQREADIAALPGRFYRAPSEPGVDATGGMETATEAPNNASGPGGFDVQGYLKALQGMDPARARQQEMLFAKPEVQPVSVPKNGALVHPVTGVPLFTNDALDNEKDGAFLQMMRKAGIDPQSGEGRSLVLDYLRKQSSRDDSTDWKNYLQTTNNPTPEGFLKYQIALRQAGAQTVTMHTPIAGSIDGQPVFVQPPNRPGAPATALTVDGKPVSPPPRASEIKPLPPKVLETLTSAREAAAAMDTLAGSFKPQYGGKGIAGVGAEAQLTAGAALGWDRDTVDWWKNYRKMVSLTERHEMFGASLTKGEKASWESADISPGMDPKVIARNLATRQAIARKVLQNTAADLTDAGYDANKIGSIAGRQGAKAAAAEGIPPGWTVRVK